jgi:hypothetical protein
MRWHWASAAADAMWTAERTPGASLPGLTERMEIGEGRDRATGVSEFWKDHVQVGGFLRSRLLARGPGASKWPWKGAARQQQ